MAKQAFWDTTEERRQSVLKAAAKEFADQGYRGANVNTIAAKAGIGKGSIYFFFQDKMDLFLTTISQGLALVEDIFDQLYTIVCDQGFFVMIEESIAFARRFSEEHPDMYRMYCNYFYGGRKEFQEEMDKVYKDFIRRNLPRLVEEGIRRGDLRTDISSPLLGFLFYFSTMRFQDTLNLPMISPELELARDDPRAREVMVREFIEVLKSGIMRK